MKLSEYLHNKIATDAMRRSWSELPPDFERDAVRWTYKHHIGVLIDRRDIAARIKASKAATFDELKAAVDSLKFDTLMCDPYEEPQPNIRTVMAQEEIEKGDPVTSDGRKLRSDK